MRAVSFFRLGGGASGAGLTGAGAGVGAGGLGEETGKGGDGGTNWGVFSGNFVSAPGGSGASRGGKAIRTVSFFGSFGSGIKMWRIGSKTLLEMAALSLAKFIAGKNLAPAIGQELKPRDRIRGFR